MWQALRLGAQVAEDGEDPAMVVRGRTFDH